jgi:hypothetical protein
MSGSAGGARRRGEVVGAVSRGKAAIAAGSAELSGGFIVGAVVGVDGKDEGHCVMRISGKGENPAHYPDSAIDAANFIH